MKKALGIAKGFFLRECNRAPPGNGGAKQMRV